MEAQFDGLTNGVHRKMEAQFDGRRWSYSKGSVTRDEKVQEFVVIKK
jgi:hypothetical protein